MFKKSLLLMLFVALLAPWAANAQTLTVYDGETTTNRYIPIDGYNVDGTSSKSEYIIPASALADMNGKEITQMTLYLSTVGNKSWGNARFRVFMKEVENTTISNFTGYSDATVVYYGALDCQSSTMDVVFNVNTYIYNGGNLLIGFYIAEKGTYTGGYNNYKPLYSGETVTGASVGGTSATQRDFLPKTTFTYQTPATCPKPTILPASDITTISATVSFTETGSANAWTLQYGTDSNFGTGTYEEVTSGFNTEASPTITKDITGLSELTKYYVRVKSVCNPGTDESDWSNTIDFTTTQNPVVVGDGWSDDFEGESCGWQFINGSLTNANWAWGQAVNNGGTHSIYISNDNGVTNSYNNSGYAKVYATKLLTFADGKYNFQFDWKCVGESNSSNGYYYDYLRAGLVPATTTLTADDGNSQDNPTGWIAIHDQTNLCEQSTWTTSPEKTVSVEAGNYYLVLRWRQDNSSGSNPAAVDNVTITRVACGYDVTGLEVEDDPAPTAHTATINWTAGEATQWQVAWSKDNSFPAANTQTDIVSSATKELTELEASSTYFVRVRAYCGGTDYGQWCNAINFDTECEIITTFPWDNNFDSYTGVTSGTTNNLPGCWNYLNTSTYSSNKGYPVIYNYSYNAHSGTNYLYFYSYYSTSYDYDPQDEYAILPEMSDANSKMLTFYAKRNYSEISLKVGLMTDPKDASTFNGVQDVALTTSYAKYTVTLTGNGNYIALMMEKANGTVTGPGIYVDDIAVMAAPDCATPTGLAVTANSQTPEGATITWTAGDASSWIVEYKKGDENTWTAVAEPVNTPTHTFTGLDYSTQYNARVKVNCTAGSGVTYPTDPVNFTTTIQYPAPKNLVVSNITDKTATLSWTPGYQETSWVVKYKKHADAEYTIAEPNPVTTNPTINLTALTGATSYDVQVYNSNNMGTPLTQSNAFSTAFGVPFFEDFETSQTAIPSGWTRYEGLLSEVLAGTTSLAPVASTWSFTNGSPMGNYSAYINIFSNNRKHWLVTPTIINNNDNSLSFEIGRYQYTAGTCDDDIFAVLYSIDGGTNWAILAQWDNAGSSYVYNEIPVGKTTDVFLELPAETKNKAILIGFYGESTVNGNGDYNVRINDIGIDATPSCLRPSTVTSSNVTNHSATISWTPGEAGQSAWQIAYYKGANFNPAEVNLDTIPTLMVQDNPTYTFDKTLDADSAYYFYVRANCGTTAEPDYSAWSKKVCAIATTVNAPAPTGFAKTNVGPDWVDLKWNAPAGDFLSGYGLYYSTTSTTPDPTEEALKTINDPAAYTAEAPYHFTGLSANTTYYFWIRANHEANVYSAWQAISGTYFTTPEACAKPTALAASEPSPNSIKLSWTAGAEWQTSWVIAYSKTSGFDPEDTEACTYVDADTNPFVVPGLNSETQYYFRVKGNCGNTYGESEWNTTEATETTLVSCPAPTDIVASNLTQNTADLTWTGYSDSYEVVYRALTPGETSQTSEDFSGYTPTTYNVAGSLPEGWKGYSTGSNKPHVSSNSVLGTSYDLEGFAGGEGSTNNFLYMIGNTTSTKTSFTILPQISNLDAFSFDYGFESASNGTLTVGYCTDNDSGSTFTAFDDLTITASQTSVTVNLTEADIALVNSNNGYLTFCWTYGGSYGVGIDNVSITAVAYTAGEWIDPALNTTTESINIDNLTAGTKYEVKVQGTCGSTPSGWSDNYSFKTLAEGNKVFTTEGNWDVAANWAPTGVPSITDNAIIRANATIESGVVAMANQITIEGSPKPTLTIADGGQLQTSSNVTATVKKNIEAYTIPETTNDEHKANGYYLISSPVFEASNPSSCGMITTASNYDLYQWDYSEVGEEWQNYKDPYVTFSIENGKGYLYANAAKVVLSFTGTVIANNSDKTVNLDYTTYGTSPTFNGWDLVGNPFVCTAYITLNGSSTEYPMAYYRMNAAGNGVEASTASIAPMEGIFVEAKTTGQSIQFSRNEPAKASGNGNLNINLAQTVTTRGAKGDTDNAIVRFDGGNTLGKFSFRENSAKVYIPQDGKDYAVVSAESYGELPVNFKAAENGNYTLCFTTEDVEFSYLHLIDNLTGNDVDLLQTPSYNFDAQYTDIAARFKLVFAKSNDDMGDDFGFIDANGNLLILGIDGTATLQVVDVTGRVLSSETFSGNYSKPVKAAAGVYMLRLIQGNDSRTQKIVVK